MYNTSDGKMRHAKLPFAVPQVHETHPFKHKVNHDSLLEYCQQRLALGKQERDDQLDRMARIDRKVAGWIKLKDSDIKRAEHTEKTGEPLVTNMNLPLAFVHLDDMMTYLAETFSPSRGMFYNTGNPAETGPAEQIVTKLNNDALYAGYYRQVLHALFATLKYNLGGITSSWGSDNGPTKTVGQTAEDRAFDAGVKWQGNRVKALDNYNTLRDPTVHPVVLHTEGEFCAYVEMKSRYWLQTRAVNGQLYNVSRAVQGSDSSTCRYYVHPPQEAMLAGESSGTDWISILSAAPSRVQDGHEIVTLYIRLNPVEFGLVPASEKPERNRYELWRLTIVDDSFISAATWQNNVHNHIPCYFGVTHDDVMGLSQRGPAELLIPLQDFGSHLLNTHQEAARKSIYGTTVYDPTMVDLTSIPKGEVAARLPVSPRAYGRDIRTFVHELRNEHDTSHTMRDLEVVMGLVNQFFPTQALPSQIASIDRAVSSQVAAVQHGANRRQQKNARLLDDSMFRPMRFGLYYNILQYQPDGEELTDFYTGKQVKLDIAGMSDTNLPFIIGQGLKAIDRMASMEMMQQLIFSLIQAPQASQGIDLLGLIDFWTTMMDIDIDMKQFRLQPPGMGDNGGPPLDDAAAAEAAAAGGAESGGRPIIPAVNPQSVSSPIFG